jgi:2,4-dienoyl-CoA reductase-like NADH-dependent reductase (Old Yellow Enzyme family)
MFAHDSKPSMLLQQPGQMGPLRLKNRVVMGPIGTNFGTTDGFSTERDKIYCAVRARGGAAMIITEAMVVSAMRAIIAPRSASSTIASSRASPT